MRSNFAAVLAAAALGVGTSQAAAGQTYVCAEAKDGLAKNPALMDFAKQSFGGLQFRAWSEKEPCAFPTALLSYKFRTVLISTAEPPYQAHACEATMTAHVFATDRNSVRLERTAKNFAKTGENCLAGRFKPVTISGLDAFAVEGSGGGQGARAGWLEFYRIESDTIRQFRLPGLTCVWVDYANAGPAAADMDTIHSSWRIGGRNNDRLFLDFRIAKPKAKPKTLRTEWTFGDGGLKLIRGKLPEAFADGACL